MTRSETVIKIEGLSKRYRLGLVGSSTLKDDLKGWWYRARGKEDPALKIGEENRLDTQYGNYVWALKDINLEVKQGEVLGIIGKNGAGKSTLLKILSRVTGPSKGLIKTKGRIASLLEVGTGMHPELTGRENVFLNGAILGMTRPEIRSKFDEIVDFAGVARYIDTPVKRYSSGMHVRLGFAVAAFLEPEIFIVDEVLAVGDVEFQRKAIGKMQDVSKGQGRTVLFVSHNMASILNLCTRGLLLSNGMISSSGDIESIVNKYAENSTEVIYNTFIRDETEFSNERKVALNNLSLLPKLPKTGDKVVFDLEIINNGIRLDAEVAISFKDKNENKILQFYSQHVNKTFSLKSGMNSIRLVINEMPLVEGIYRVSLWIGNGRTTYDWKQNSFILKVETGQFERGKYIDSRGYPVVIRSNWILDDQQNRF